MRKTLIVSISVALLSLTSTAFALSSESSSYKAVRSVYRENIGLKNSGQPKLAIGLSSSGALKTASLKKGHSPTRNAKKFITPQRVDSQAQNRLSNFWSDWGTVLIGPLGALVAVAGFVTLFVYMQSWPIGLSIMLAGLVMVLISAAVAPI